MGLWPLACVLHYVLVLLLDVYPEKWWYWGVCKIGHVLNTNNQQHLLLHYSPIHLPQLTALHDLLQFLQHLQRHPVEVEQRLVIFLSHHHLFDHPLAVSIQAHLRKYLNYLVRLSI